VSTADDTAPMGWPGLSATPGLSENIRERPAASEHVADVSMPDTVPVPVTDGHSYSEGTASTQAARPQAAARPAGNRWQRDLRWPLLVVLAVQAALSARLVWSNTAFQDEALYLRAGHLEWARWLHGTPIPDFPSYFSGAPVLYPPIGALADSIGGLTAARILSLCLMLGVTSLLWSTTGRLYGQRAALLAAGLFATLAGTQFLGAFATFDAMALFLLSLAAWLGVRSADSSSWARAALLTATGVTLAAADSVKYATALFTPVVLVVVALATWRRQRGAAWLVALAAVLASWLIPVAAAIHAGGPDYWQGITTSTLSRAQSDVPATVVLQRSYVWTGLILVLAVLGVFLASRTERRAKLLPAVLLAAAVLAPAEQARLHTTVSLQKHVVFGAWFAAIAAGYAMARLSRVDPGRGWAAVLALPIAASTLFGSMGQAGALYRVWPDSAAAVSVLRSAARSHPGNYLAEDYDVEAYYLRAQVPWQRWSSTYYFRYPGAQPGEPSYEAAIRSHYFALVILSFTDTVGTDREITADMRSTGGYYVIARAGRYTIWASRGVRQ
jgi:4-amino-4-deoxy-L-arabinose transferase-like glycosyltransferase